MVRSTIYTGNLLCSYNFLLGFLIVVNTYVHNYILDNIFYSKVYINLSISNLLLFNTFLVLMLIVVLNVPFFLGHSLKEYIYATGLGLYEFYYVVVIVMNVFYIYLVHCALFEWEIGGVFLGERVVEE